VALQHVNKLEAFWRRQPSPHVCKRDLLNFFLSRRDSDEYISLCLYNKGHHHLNIYMIIMKIKLSLTFNSAMKKTCNLF